MYYTLNNSNPSNKDLLSKEMQRDSGNYDNSNYDYDHNVNHPSDGDDVGNHSYGDGYDYYGYEDFLGYDYPEDRAITTLNYVSKCFIIFIYNFLCEGVGLAFVLRCIFTLYSKGYTVRDTPLQPFYATRSRNQQGCSSYCISYGCISIM